jgi:small subunit ribosomal protein S16
LSRTGARNRPFYRIVAAETGMPRDGRAIEQLGSYNPVEKPVIIKINEARVVDRILKGAQVSPTVAGLLRRTHTLEKIDLIRKGQQPKIEGALAVEVKERTKKKKARKKGKGAKAATGAADKKEAEKKEPEKKEAEKKEPEKKEAEKKEPEKKEAEKKEPEKKEAEKKAPEKKAPDKKEGSKPEA